MKAVLSIQNTAYSRKKKTLHLFLTHNVGNEIPNIVKDRL